MTQISAQSGQKRGVIRDCGPEGCELDWLSSKQIEAEVDDISAFTEFAMQQGWGDGLPLIPPTMARVRGFLMRASRRKCAGPVSTRTNTCHK